jgi:hypothetical protein
VRVQDLPLQVSDRERITATWHPHDCRISKTRISEKIAPENGVSENLLDPYANSPVYPGSVGGILPKWIRILIARDRSNYYPEGVYATIPAADPKRKLITQLQVLQVTGNPPPIQAPSTVQCCDSIVNSRVRLKNPIIHATSLSISVSERLTI